MASVQSKAEVTERGGCGWQIMDVALGSAERLQIQCQIMPENNLEYIACSA